MSCFPCFGLSKTNKLVKQLDDVATSTVTIPPSTPATTLPPAEKHKLDRPPPKAPSKKTSRIPSKIVQGKKQRTSSTSRTGSVKLPGSVSISARTFTFSEIAAATRNFKVEHLLGEGGFGPVYKGWLEDGKVVAVKKLDLHGRQGNQEFLVEVLMLRLLHHPNLVNLIGFCSEGDQRILVYEYMPRGSLENHLHHLKAGKEPLDWNTRLRIAEGAAKGLQYLHEGANPPVIYRDLKSSNILLDEGFHPKLSDFGLAKLGPVGDKSHVSTRVMGTYGYCAPEYAMTGKLTQKSDIYSFGVVLLELLTGQKPIDETRPKGKQSLVIWARPYLFDPNKKIEIVDPWLIERAPKRSLLRALAVAEACLHDQPDHRAPAGDVVNALVWIRNSRSNASDSARNSIKRPADREKAVAEARLWAENVKDSKKQQRG